jgi:nicotinate-nucleotide adenylyltransferase
MIAIFGGSFDPPHLGHKNVLNEFLKFYPKTKKLILIPNFLSPFKETKIATKNQVVDMLKIFAAGFRIPVEISTIEIDKKEKSYTIDTLRSLKKKYPNEELFFLLGEDHIQTFSKWKDSEKILELVQLVFFQRYKSNTIIFPTALKRSILLQSNIVEISSSEIRNDFDKNLDFIEKNVSEYIREHSIYGRL